jgi:hypothetical protein
VRCVARWGIAAVSDLPGDSPGWNLSAKSGATQVRQCATSSVNVRSSPCLWMVIVNVASNACVSPHQVRPIRAERERSGLHFLPQIRAESPLARADREPALQVRTPPQVRDLQQSTLVIIVSAPAGGPSPTPNRLQPAVVPHRTTAQVEYANGYPVAVSGEKHVGVGSNGRIRRRRPTGTALE